ncbi:hypothetical protein [Sulfitobacter sp. R18_1]|uniref:hypothetical protein n=1 Tax=Sulfitobacter sp. R18_1 TaxID=2821104 RepID=UPI001ADCE4F1|nr:hypothetical protein [Sulfitobacter sp. R18_1]MBO9427962.1 hypothetical protein [Sulfitobacter sp. R18_1]
MKAMKIFAAIAVAGALSACSGSDTVRDMVGETYTDNNYSSGAKPSPAVPTGLGVGVVQNIYLKPGSKTKSGAVPPVGYTNQWWTDPETNCEYSRATYGGQVSWTLILNPPGKPLAKASCMKHFVSEGPLVPGYRHVGNGNYVYDKATDPLLQPRPMMSMDVDKWD